MLRFNGATAFRRWKVCRREGVRHSLSCFNGATAFRRWKAAGGASRFSAQTGFNGATAFRRWKDGLWSFGHGLEVSFNGATAFRRWKAIGPQRRPSPPAGFNGATAFRRWKGVKEFTDFWIAITASMGPPPFGDGKLSEAKKPNDDNCLLQWGHRLSAMES